MLFTRRGFPALATLALLPLAACKDSNGPDRHPVGEVRFTYSGAASGSFDAEGRVTVGNSGTFAGGEREDDRTGNGILLIYAQEARSDTDKHDRLVIGFEDPAEGTVTCTGTTPNCPFFSSVVLGQYVVGSESGYEALFYGTIGQLTITEMDDDRVRGTFTLSMTGLDAASGLEVRSGTFDVPLLEVNDEPFSLAEFGILAP